MPSQPGNQYFNDKRISLPRLVLEPAGRISLNRAQIQLHNAIGNRMFFHGPLSVAQDRYFPPVMRQEVLHTPITAALCRFGQHLQASVHQIEGAVALIKTAQGLATQFLIVLTGKLKSTSAGTAFFETKLPPTCTVSMSMAFIICKLV